MTRSARPATLLAAVLALIAALSIGLATPAGAHAGDGTSGSNFRTVFTDPATDCLTWTVYDDDGYLGLRSTCGGTVTVLGYEDEPYLRFSAAGVEENRNSPAAYLNLDPQANVTVPPTANAAADPDWVMRSSLPTYRWHDHRTHWMNDQPPQTDARMVRVSEWTIPLVFDDDGTGAFIYQLEAKGELWYSAPLPWWIPLSLAAVPLGCVVVFALRRGLARPEGQVTRLPQLAGPIALLLAVIAGLTALTAIDDLVQAGRVQDPRLVAALTLVIVVGAVGWAVARGRKGDDTAFLALVGAGVALSWAYGWVDRSVLSASFLRTGLPDLALRVVVAMQLLAALPPLVALAAWHWQRRRGRAVASPTTPTTPTTGSTPTLSPR